MSRLRLERLRRMSSHEWWWRAQDVFHTSAERVLTRSGAARWKRAHIARVLSDSALDACRAHVARSDWRSVQHTLATLIAARTPRFVLDPSSSAMLRNEVLTRWPAADRDAALRADRLLEGTFDLLGYKGIRCGRDGRVDWHADPVHERRAPRVFYADVPFLNPAIGDHKIIWELNRHQHWLKLGRAAWLTGDPRYTRAICTQLESWLDDNQPFVGINWASMLEIGLRSISWTWALHCLLAGATRHDLDVTSQESPWLIDLLVGLDRQLTHSERHLSYYFSPNTHLTGEALALYVAGTALPELAASTRWVNTGRRVLLHEIDRQILADGGHVERSTHYQRYTLDFYLLATQTARLGGDSAAAHRFEAASHRLADFTRTIADGNGRVPLIGDDDGGMLWPIAGRTPDDVRDSLAVAASVLGRPELAAWDVPEEAFWIVGPHARTLRPTEAPPPRSTLFPDTGYFVASGADRSHGVLDAGPHGYLNGGHAHADALALTLSIEGRRLLIDPGTSTYTMNASWRDRMRSTASHNTVMVNGRSQSQPDGPFHWRSSVDAQVASCRCNPAFDVVEAAHNGYRPVRHRRTVVRTRHAGWLIVDAILADTGRHSAAAHWHFDPAWWLTASDERLLARHIDGSSVWMLCAGGTPTILRGGDDGAGWCAPVYGQLLPTSTVRLNTTAAAPVVLVTWIAAARDFSSPVLRCTPLNEQREAVVVTIEDDTTTAMFLVRPADSSRARAVCRVGEFETDAAFFHYLTTYGQLRSISMADGQHAISSHDAWPSLSSDRLMPDLHVAIGDNQIDCLCAETAGSLTVHGTLDCTSLRANGRELPLSSKSTTDTLLIHDTDWLPISFGNAPTAAPAHCGAAFARE
jgi:hypothetical protein